MKVLFEFTRNSTHLPIFEPVIEVLRYKYPHCEISVLALCEVVGASTDRLRVAKLARDFLQPYQTPLRMTTVRQGITKKVRNAVAYFRLLRRKGRVIKDMDNLLESLKPDVVVFANDRITPHLSVIKAAKKRKIPMLLVQESIRRDDRYKMPMTDRLRSRLIHFFFGVEERTLLYHGQGGCDRIAAWGETSLEYFKRIGVPAEKVVLTGNPRIETLAKENWRQKGEEIKRRFSFPDNASIIAFTTNPVDGMGMLTREQLDESVLMVADAAASLNNIYLVIKPHPIEDVERYRRIVAKKDYPKDRVRVESNLELYPLLSVSNACLIFNSTVALESAILGTPTAVVNPFGADMGIDFVENGLAVEVRTKIQLVDFLQRCQGAKYEVNREAMQKYVALIDGSAEKVASEIVRLGEPKHAC